MQHQLAVEKERGQRTHLEEALIGAQAGIRLADFDAQAKPHGQELRWLPSTYRSATLGDGGAPGTREHDA